MKRKPSDYIIITICLIIVGLFLFNGVNGTGSDVKVSAAGSSQITQTVVATPTPVPAELVANYSGPTVIVGEKYDKNYLTVTLSYNNGTSEIITDYTVSSDIVLKRGMNTLIIMYKDMAAKAYVYGRELLSISASPVKYDFGVGNMPDSKDFTVMGSYSDGSLEVIQDEFKISPERLEEPGKQEVTISYGGKETTCYVFGKDRGKVLSLSVAYNKPTMVTNMKINRNDITVIAVYDDFSTERITTYTLERDIYYDSGKQPLTVTYGGITKSINIEVIERYIVGLKAEYTGGVVVVGRPFRDADMHVYLEYVDGEFVETKDYTVHTRKIRYIGNNIVTVYYGDKFSDTVVIEGTELIKPNFDYVSSGKASNGEVSLKIKTAIPRYLDEDCIEITEVSKKKTKKAYRKLKLKGGDYIAFDYGFVNTDDELELPLTARITIPEGYDMEHTFLYYTPNRKTVLGRTNKTIINDRTFECTLFKVGTYMLVYSESLTEEETEE